MKRRILVILLIMSILLFACSRNDNNSEEENSDPPFGLAFKEAYESCNDVLNENGTANRPVFIPEDNPFVISSAEEIVERIENGETFYVYFGFATCPWCRSVIEKAVEVTMKKGIEKVYYVDILNIRDTEKVNEEDEIVRTSEGSDAYYQLLEYLDNVLNDYQLEDSKGAILSDEKRIYAPNFVYVEDGKALRMISAISEHQIDPREELSAEALKDEEEAFDAFFQKSVDGCRVDKGC